jgi:hypothetical protein
MRIPANSSIHSKGNRALTPRRIVHLLESNDARGYFLLDVDKLVNIGGFFRIDFLSE